jgi:hypothetical protein
MNKLTAEPRRARRTESFALIPRGDRLSKKLRQFTCSGAEENGGSAGGCTTGSRIAARSSVQTLRLRSKKVSVLPVLRGSQVIHFGSKTAKRRGAEDAEEKTGGGIGWCSFGIPWTLATSARPRTHKAKQFSASSSAPSAPLRWILRSHPLQRSPPKSHDKSVLRALRGSAVIHSDPQQRNAEAQRTRRRKRREEHWWVFAGDRESRPTLQAPILPLHPQKVLLRALLCALCASALDFAKPSTAELSPEIPPQISSPRPPRLRSESGHGTYCGSGVSIVGAG